METTLLSFSLIAIVSYLLGSIPTGVVYSKLKGVDIKTVGSGSTGATNVGRAFGMKGFISVFLLDLLKGYVATIFAMWFMERILLMPLDYTFYFLIVVFGMITLVGHSYPIFNKFKGGKGVATGFGIAIAMSWFVSIFAIVGFLLVFKTTKTVAIASISGFIVNTIVSGVIVLLSYNGIANASLELYLPLFIGSIIGTIWVFITHRSNINRIIKGEENTFKK